MPLLSPVTDSVTFNPPSTSKNSIRPNVIYRLLDVGDSTHTALYPARTNKVTQHHMHVHINPT